MGGLSHAETEGIAITIVVLSTLSALGSLGMIVTIIAMRKIKKSYWRLVVGLAITDLIQALSLVSNKINNNNSTLFNYDGSKTAGAIATLVGEPFRQDSVLCILQGKMAKKS